MGEWGPTATALPTVQADDKPSRWGNGGQPQPTTLLLHDNTSLADGGMGANRNSLLLLRPLHQSLADGGMGANRNESGEVSYGTVSLADGGMGANRNDGHGRAGRPGA